MSRTLGYEHLRVALGLSAFALDCPARETAVKQLTERGDHLAVPRELAPAADDLLGQLLFALKHEGTNLQVLAEALPQIGGEVIRRGLQETPNGRYLRLAAWLWETFTGSALEGAPPAAGPVVPVFDPARYVVPDAPGLRSRRWRVWFNGLGTPAACMTVRRTPAITAALQSDLLAEVRALQQQSDPALLDRALAWAYLGETRASFAIEREPPSEEKARNFVRLLRHAHGRQPLSEDLLVDLQRATVSNPHDQAAAFRHEQNWLQDGAPGSLGVTYVPPPPDLARELMEALMAFANGTARHVDPLVAAACVSFGFVLIHPFMDGNGRLSRFLFHHQLCQSGQLPDGLILPVSIAMAQHEREYLQALQSFSRPARECWRVQSIDRDRFHFTFTGPHRCIAIGTRRPASSSA